MRDDRVAGREDYASAYGVTRKLYSAQQQFEPEGYPKTWQLEGFLSVETLLEPVGVVLLQLRIVCLHSRALVLRP